MALTLGLASTASAQAKVPVDLEWEAPAGCPDRSAVLAETGQLLAKLPDSQPGPPLKARALVSTKGSVWKLHLEIDSKDGLGARNFDDESCVRLVQVAALALALAVDSSGTPVPPPRKVEAPPRAPNRFLIRPQFGGDFGSRRQPTFGPGLAIGLLFGRARVEAVGYYWLPQAGDGIEDQLIAGGLRACAAVLEHPEVAACVGIEAGQLTGRSLKDGSPAQGPWVATLVGAAIAFDLTDWLALRLEVALGLTMVAPIFDFANQDAHAAPLFGRAAAGIETHF